MIASMQQDTTCPGCCLNTVKQPSPVTHQVITTTSAVTNCRLPHTRLRQLANALLDTVLLNTRTIPTTNNVTSTTQATALVSAIAAIASSSTSLPLTTQPQSAIGFTTSISPTISSSSSSSSSSPSPPPPPSSSLICPECQWIPRRPVTLSCGHTSCRGCLLAAGGCPKCGHPLPARLETNVLIKAAVEKWWPKELQKERMKEEAAVLVKEQLFEQALAKYTTAMQIGREDHLILEARAEVLQKLARYELAHQDAELVIRLRPLWPKGYYRKGAILCSLGQYEDALLSFSICASLENSADRVRNEFVKAIQKFLSPGNKVITGKRAPLASWWLNNYNLQQECNQKSGEEEIIDIFNKTAISTFPSDENKKLHLLLERMVQEINKIKKSGVCGHGAVLVRELIDPEDFECVLCCRTLWRPVTTPCGHTYCSLCLDRCLDYSPNCPLCMTSLSQYLSSGEKLVTEFLTTALSTFLPEEYRARLESHIKETSVVAGVDFLLGPDESVIPVFVCTTAYPTVSCPLFVFEPRYRLMVRRAVESNRGKFGIAACVQQINGVKRYADYGTLLVIRDWVLMSDGCSILSNVGLRRFKVLSRGERDGYDTAHIQFIYDDIISVHSLVEMKKLHDRVRERGIKWFSQMSREMQEKILRTFGEMPASEPHWWMTLENGPAWAWWLVAILPLGQRLKVGILGTTCLEKRLRAIEKTLKHLDEQPSSIEAVASSQENSLKRMAPQTNRLT